MSKALASTFLIAFLAVASIVVAIPPAKAQPRHGGTLVWGIPSDPPHLVCAGPPTWIFHQVSHQICNSLIAFDPVTLRWLPELAQSWKIEVVGERMTVTFNLVRNATWHDGKPFTSADVKFTYLETGPVFSSFLADFKKVIEAIETPDDYTVIFKLKEKYAGAMFSGFFGGSSTGIMPKHLYEGTDYLKNPYNLKPIGTGPWKFVEWKKGDYIILERNKDYWKKGIPYLDRIVFKIIPTEPARALAFERGEIDFWWGIGFSYADAVRLQNEIGLGRLSGKRVWFWPSPCGSIDYLGFNLHPEGPAPLKDVRVRRAIAAAIDRKVIVERVLYGRVEALNNPASTAPATRYFYDPNIKQPDYDPAIAEKLLDEAGYKRGPDGVRFSIRITVDAVGYPHHVKSAELMRDFLKQVGVDLKIITLESAAWHETVFRKWDFDTSIFPYCVGPGSRFLTQYWSAKGIMRASWTNAGGYNNTKYNELVYQAEKELDLTKQAELLKAAIRILVEDQPGVWLNSRTFINAVNLDFSEELQPGVWEAGGGHAYQKLEKVYWLKAPPPVIEVPKPVEVPVVKEVVREVPVISWEQVAVIVVAIVIVGSAVILITRRGRKTLRS